MIASNYYPKLSSVLNLDNLPDQLSFIEGGLENLLDDVFVRDYQIVKSRKGDSISYFLVLKIYKRIGIEVPGAFTILLNPPKPGDPDPLSSEIPVSVQVQAEILKYIQNFDVLKFSAEPKAFFDLFLELLGIDVEELFDDLIAAFTQSNTVNEIVAKLNEANNLIGTIDEITFPSSATRIEQIEEVIEAIESGGSGLTAIGAVFTLLSDGKPVDEIKENLNQLFRSRLGGNPIDRIKKLFKPKINASLKVSPVIEFPRNVLLPIKPDGTVEEDELVKSRLEFDIGEFTFSTEGGIGYDKALTVTFPPEYPKAQIGNTGLTLGFTNAKLDLSAETNIPEATADGRPNSFKGVYIETASIGLPPFIQEDPDNIPVGVEIVGRNLIIGTGGISGTIGLETSGDGLCKKFGDKLKACFNSFDITFQQNSIVSSNINGTLIIPGFQDSMGGPAEININIHFGEDGDFQVTASEDQSITAVEIENVLSIELSSVFVGRKDGRWFIGLSGAVNFEDLGGAIGNFLPDKIDIKKLIVWEDGKIELEGGKITLPKAVSLKLGPVELSVTAIGMGSHEQEHLGVMRDYKYFTFDGGVNINPGGVEASGNGIALYWSKADSDLGLPLHFFMRIQSIAIDIIIPGNAKPADAALLLSGFLAMKDTGSGTEYQGGVSFTLPKLKMGGSAAMRLNPKVPAFIIDVGLELSTPILLGATGLGIYGFRGLVGQRYVATKGAAGVDDAEPWWKYYKAKIEPDYKEGIQVSKFDQTNGFSLGAGVSLATATDGGKIFSSKIFFLLSLPEVFLLQGQGQVLKERVGLDTTQDPPFFALVAITSSSVETAFGVDYKMPDDGDEPGAIATVQGVLETGFYWGDSFAWYLNIGKDEPENRRIQVRLLSLFNAYFYFMISNNGLRAGAGASFEVNKKFGPLKAELSAYLDVAGRLSRRPKQMGGSIQLGGAVELSIFGFGFRISAAASLAAESGKPFIVSGSVKVCVRVLRKDRCAKFSFTWTFRDELDESETPLFKASLADSGKALNMQTEETFELWTGTALPSNPNTTFSKNIIPMDSYIDIEFLKGVLPSATVLDNFGGNTMGSNHLEYVPPQRGKSDRVKHTYSLESVEILYHNGSGWLEFDIYAANTPMDLAPFVTTDYTTFKSGFWQYQAPNLHNKLRIMAQSPLSFASMGSGDLVVEDLGITVEEIFCEPDPIEKFCVNFVHYQIPGQPANSILIPEGQWMWNEKFLFQLIGADGKIVDRLAFGLSKGVRISAGNQLEIVFAEPQACVTLKIDSLGEGTNVQFYQRVVVPGDPDGGGLIESSYIFELVETRVISPLDSGIIDYDNADLPIDRIVIEAGVCDVVAIDPCSLGRTQQGEDLEALLDMLSATNKLVATTELSATLFTGVWLGSSLYNPTEECMEADPIWRPILITSTSLVVDITDDCGFYCRVELSIIEPVADFLFGEIVSFENMRPNPDTVVDGENYNFLIDGRDKEGAVYTFAVKSCYVAYDCADACASYLYSVCVLNVEDAIFNATIPTAVSVEEEIQTILQSFNESIQPIWRPNTNYAIQIKTKDKLNREGGASLTEYNRTVVFGFRTMGPIGHFHTYRKDDGTEQNLPVYQTHVNENKEDEFKLQSLLHYIDFPKCFPNADGQLINAKPLFYVNPKLLLYYTKNYVYEMLHNWSAWGGLEALDVEFRVTILDPAAAEGEGAETGTLTWTLSELPIISEDIIILNNMMTFGDPCSTTTIIDPQYPVSNFQLPELKPLKLYTAVFYLDYKRDSEIETVSREVLRYGFQTSKYASFTEQVQSWELVGDSKTGGATANAVFVEALDFDPADIATAITVVDNTLAKESSLRQEFGHQFNRLVEGALKLKALDSPLGTEFNIIKDNASGNILGVYIKNPEPFNDPKLPIDIVVDTLIMTVNGTGTFVPIFAKDYASVFITNNALNLAIADGDTLGFTFEYQQYNGVTYDVVTTETVSFIINI